MSACIIAFTLPAKLVRVRAVGVEDWVPVQRCRFDPGTGCGDCARCGGLYEGEGELRVICGKPLPRSVARRCG